MFAWTVLKLFFIFLEEEERKKERTNLPLLDLSALPQVKIECNMNMLVCSLLRHIFSNEERTSDLVVHVFLQTFSPKLVGKKVSNKNILTDC